MRILKGLVILVCLLVVAFCAVAFVAHNQSSVEVNLLFTSVREAKLGFWLIGFFIAGGLAGSLASSSLLVRERLARRRLEKRMSRTSKIISEYSS